MGCYTVYMSRSAQARQNVKRMKAKRKFIIVGFSMVDSMLHNVYLLEMPVGACGYNGDHSAQLLLLLLLILLLLLLLF